MQKVIIITTSTEIPKIEKLGNPYSEELPTELNKALEEGYAVKEVVDLTPAQSSRASQAVFILEKHDR